MYLLFKSGEHVLRSRFTNTNERHISIGPDKPPHCVGRKYQNQNKLLMFRRSVPRHYATASGLFRLTRVLTWTVECRDSLNDRKQRSPSRSFLHFGELQHKEWELLAYRKCRVSSKRRTLTRIYKRWTWWKCTLRETLLRPRGCPAFAMTIHASEWCRR